MKNCRVIGLKAYFNDVNASSLFQRVTRIGTFKHLIILIGNFFNFSCGCGRLSSAHSQPALSRFTTSVTKSCNSTTSQKWMIENHTASSPTDAYGIIEFQVTNFVGFIVML